MDQNKFLSLTSSMHPQNEHCNHFRLQNMRTDMMSP